MKNKKIIIFLCMIIHTAVYCMEEGDYDSVQQHKIAAQRAAIKTVMERDGFTHIKCPEVGFCLPDGNKQLIKIDAAQARELSALYRCVYLHDSYITINNGGVYVIPNGVNGEHFVTSWQKIWFNGLEFDSGALEILNKKQEELQAYVLKCLKDYKTKNPTQAIEDYMTLPLLPHAKEVEIKGCGRIYRMPLHSALQNLFANDEQETNFWERLQAE